MNTWILEETEIPLGRLRKQESLLSQGNGYLGWRGTFEEGAAGDSLEGNYINGFYETYPVKYPESAYGYPESGQTMLNVMNGKWLRIEVDGEAVTMRPERVSAYSRRLDFRDGLLRRTFEYRTAKGQRIRCVFKRLVSFTRPHCGAISLRVEMLEGEGEVRIISGLETRVRNQAADKDPRVGAHLPPENYQTLRAGAEAGALYAASRTLRSGLSIACAVFHPSYAQEAAKHTSGGGLGTYTWARTLRAGEGCGMEKTIAYYTTKRPEKDGEGLLEQALGEARAAGQLGFESLLKENAGYLAGYWHDADIQIRDDDVMQHGLRCNSFHILQSVGRDGERNIAAKGLSGEGYEGHYFWDAEVFVIPALLHSRPEICRALLCYRIAHLDGARARARELNHKKGALFPWRTIGGSECSTFFPAGTAQYHINGDIAYALRLYILATGDGTLLQEGGAELLFETARLWMEAGHFNPRKQNRFCIDTVTGPDEYTALVNNNFYTNRVAEENLWYAFSVHAWMERETPEALAELARRIGLEAGEAEAWRDAAERMYLPYDQELGIHLQDDSFADKADWDFAGTPAEHYPLLLHYHPLVLYRHKVLKQADTVLADLLFDEGLATEQIRRDYAYYEPITTHDSSLSACVYSMVACRVGELEKAYQYFLRTARTDLEDQKGNTRDGVHIANMAGSAMCVLNGFAGVRVRPGSLRLWPQLPPRWREYAFRLRYQGSVLRVLVSREGVRLNLEGGGALTVYCYETPYALEVGQALEVAYQERRGEA